MTSRGNEKKAVFKDDLDRENFLRTGRTVQSVGLTIYYVGKTGVKVVSPTVEGGLLSGAMHKTGEEIYYLPVSDKEMNNVMQSVYDTLSEVKSANQEKATAETGQTDPCESK